MSNSDIEESLIIPTISSHNRKTYKKNTFYVFYDQIYKFY